jgi:hypothetical protein
MKAASNAGQACWGARAPTFVPAGVTCMGELVCSEGTIVLVDGGHRSILYESLQGCHIRLVFAGLSLAARRAA